MQCEWLLPNWDWLLSPDQESYSCLLPKGHEGDHLIRIHDGRYVCWLSDAENCEDCVGLDEMCDCFTYGFLEPAEAKQLLQQGKLATSKE